MKNSTKFWITILGIILLYFFIIYPLSILLVFLFYFYTSLILYDSSDYGLYGKANLFYLIKQIFDSVIKQIKKFNNWLDNL